MSSNQLDLSNINDCLQNLPFTTESSFKIGGSSGVSLANEAISFDVNLVDGKENLNIKDSEGNVLFNLDSNGVPVFKSGNSPLVSVQSKDLYISSSSGNDLTGDGSSSNRWKTIQKAFNGVAYVPKHVNTIYLAKGTYNNQEIMSDGSENKKFNLISSGVKGVRSNFSDSSSVSKGSIRIIAESYFSSEESSATVYSSTSNTLTVQGVTWVSNHWVDAKLVLYDGATMGGSAYNILSNTVSVNGQSTITIDRNWDGSLPDSSTVFDILTTKICGSLTGCPGTPDNLYNFLFQNSENIYIKGLWFQYPKKAAIYADNSSITMEHCYIDMDNGDTDATGILISRSKVDVNRVAIYNGPASGMLVKNSSEVLLKGSLFYDSLKGLVVESGSYARVLATSFSKNDIAVFAYYFGTVFSQNNYSLGSSYYNGITFSVENGGRVIYKGTTPSYNTSLSSVATADAHSLVALVS